ncbi:Uncharacterised protein [Mycobacteroides abscessus subsp. bolletii]|nr:Uncharacterised protein [Mycobacteroides abscessus subsp. bolletii]
MAATLAGLGLLAHHTVRGAAASAAERDVTGQRHLETAAADLDNQLLAGQGLVLVGCLTTSGERLDGVVPLGLDPAGVDGEAVLVADEGRVGHHGAVERDDGGQAFDVELGQCAPRAGEGLVAVAAGHDQLGQHGVELAADHGSGLNARIQAHAGTGRGVIHLDRSGGRQEVAAGVLAVDAELDRVATRLGVFGELQRLAVGDLELLEHQIDARGLLGDGVFHLQTGVDLEEGDQAVLAHQVFHGAGTVVPGLLADALGGLVDLLALGVGQERRRRLFDQLLEAALQRAVAGAGDHDIAVLVGDDLGLDVARLVQVALHEALAATERGDGLAGGRLEQLGYLFEGAGHLHAAATAAEGGLDGDGQTMLLGEGHDLVSILHGIGGTGNQRGLRARRNVAGGDLVAEVADGLRAGPDPDQPGIDDGLGKVCIL